MSAMAATGAALRLRLLFRMLRVGELLALAALLSWSTSRAPSAAAAAVRVAGSLLFSPRFVFVLGNAIVLLLLALSRRERDPSPPVSSAPNHHPVAATSSAGAVVDHIPEAPAAATYPSFATSTTPTPMPASEAPAAPAALVVLPCREMETVFEEEVKPAMAMAAMSPRVVVSKARAPRRSRSEKMSSPRGVGGTLRRAASPEQQMPVMRRSESDNGRRRRSSASARDVAGWSGTEDAEEFRRTVEAFIAKQTRFRREEECMAGALVVVE